MKKTRTAGTSLSVTLQVLTERDAETGDERDSSIDRVIIQLRDAVRNGQFPLNSILPLMSTKSLSTTSLHSKR